MPRLAVALVVPIVAASAAAMPGTTVRRCAAALVPAGCVSFRLLRAANAHPTSREAIGLGAAGPRDRRGRAPAVAAARRESRERIRCASEKHTQRSFGLYVDALVERSARGRKTIYPTERRPGGQAA